MYLITVTVHQLSALQTKSHYAALSTQGRPTTCYASRHYAMKLGGLSRRRGLTMQTNHRQLNAACLAISHISISLSAQTGADDSKMQMYNTNSLLRSLHLQQQISPLTHKISYRSNSNRFL